MKIVYDIYSPDGRLLCVTPCAVYVKTAGDWLSGKTVVIRAVPE